MSGKPSQADFAKVLFDRGTPPGRGLLLPKSWDLFSNPNSYFSSDFIINPWWLQT